MGGMKLETQMLRTIRRQGKSDETHKTYWHWCDQFMRFVKQRDGRWRHPNECGRPEVEAWLTDLANRKNWVSKNTQNVALQSVCYLFREVLGQPLEGVNALRAKRPQRTRDVADVSEIAAIFNELRGVNLLAAQLMYGCGLRIGDVVNLRIKDLSFERRQIHIYSGKGDKDRYVGFPAVLHAAVRRQIESMRVLHADDVRLGLRGVSLPAGWGRKSPTSHLNFAWWYLFASDRYSRCPRSGVLLRHHRDTSHISRQIALATRAAGVHKRITSHCLRHSYATHSNEQGVDIRTLQVLLGHSDIRTTETYVHCNQDRATAARSPLELLLARPDLAVRPAAAPKPLRIHSA